MSRSSVGTFYSSASSALSTVIVMCVFVLLTRAQSPSNSSTTVTPIIIVPCPTGFVNFGDSLTDTGNAVNAFPFLLDPENSPYGETFFGRPSKRFSNGRLVPDFFSLAFKLPLLDPYFSPTRFNFRYGINLAEGGATASQVITASTPFSLTVQITHFVRFIGSATTASPLACNNFAFGLPAIDLFPNWLYTIEIGGNEILSSLTNGVQPQDIKSTVVPEAIRNVTSAVETLYRLSARKFLLFNIPAQGCSTVAITLVPGPTDEMGCMAYVNALAQFYNSALTTAVQEMRLNFPDASIALFDYYKANLEILQNPATYGFDPNKTTTACCGAPGVGTLNYNPGIQCGRNGSNSCTNPEKYVNWDGVHFTDSFYRTISLFALNGNFTDSGTNYTQLCGLDFSTFVSSVSYAQVYGGQCSALF